MELAPRPRKTLLSSKTVLANALGAPLVYSAAVELFPQVQPWIAAHPQTLVLGMSVMNVVLRHFTGGGIQYGRKHVGDDHRLDPAGDGSARVHPD